MDQERMTDAELMERGFVKVQAFTRADSAGAKTRTAERSQRFREKALEAGAAQINIVAPKADHAALKDLAKKLQAGQRLEQAMESMLAANKAAASEVGTPSPKNLAWWQRWRAVLLGILFRSQTAPSR